jgi:superfamily I DNA/RNA helicase
VLVGAFRAIGIPYQLHGPSELLQTRVVRDLLAYLQLAVNPDDRLALLRVASCTPSRLQSLAAALVEEPVALAELLGRAAEFGTDTVAAAARLTAAIYDLHAHYRRGLAPAALLDLALDRSGYRVWLEQHPDGTRRLRLLLRFRAVLERLEISVSDWVERAALGDDIGNDADDEAVRLTSVHGSKGQEFRAVFLIGVEEGLIPHHRALTAVETEIDDESLQEELRGLYVGVTRARERLCLSACLRRVRGDRSESRQPSRWLRALQPDLVAV